MGKLRLEKIVIGTLETMNCGVICFTPGGKCKYANLIAQDLFCNTSLPFFQKQCQDWNQRYHFQKQKSGFSWQETVEKDGNQKYLLVQYNTIADEISKKEQGFFFKVEDRTEETLALQTEQYLASHDTLTGLYQREYFFKKVEEELEKRPDQPRYMIATNIKNFKLINDLFGEKFGDIVLKEQAKELQKANYPGTIHGRISNDRYAMLIDVDKFNPEYASKNTGRLQNLLSKYNYQLRIHIGIYRISDFHESPVVMYDKASMAINQIHDQFQKIFCFYDENLMEKLIHERNITSEFDYALENGQFSFYLQPQMNVNSQVVGAEAVVRWNHPKRGLLKPKDFLHVLEKTGLLVKMDMYIWEEVAKKIAEWKAADRKYVPISVNISAKDFFFLDLYEHFTDLVSRYGIEPKDLNLEITEKVFMDDARIHIDILNKLQLAGFSIEIDDFGSGYSSLNLLKDIRADKIKIDMLFLQEMRYEERSTVILNTICKMAEKLNTPVIMEGIESVSQLSMMKDMGCQIFQGSYFSLPVPASVFETTYLR